MKNTIKSWFGKAALCLSSLGLLSSTSSATVLLSDTFTYPAGSLVSGSTPWQTHSGTTGQLQVESGSLTYPGLGTSSGNKISISQSNSEDVNRTFSANVTTEGSEVFASFIMNVPNATSTAGDYFFHFANDTGSPSTDLTGTLLRWRGRLFLKKGTGSNYQVGLRWSGSGDTASPASDETVLYDATERPFNTPVLIVVRLRLVAGALNDDVSLWVNPTSLGAGVAPAPLITRTNQASFNSADTDPVLGVKYAVFRESGTSGFEQVDELRVATTWAEVTSPLVVAGDNPNILASTSLTYTPITPAATQDQEIVINNSGSSAVLNVTGAAVGGTDVGKFSVITALPLNIAAGSSATLTVRFTPAGASGSFSGTVTLTSNDQGGDSPVVALAASSAEITDPAIVISEVTSRPTSDEFIELVNVSGATVDMGGYVLSDDDNGNSEGAVQFAVGTSIAANEVIIVAVGTDDINEPTWLDTLPAGVRVFVDPARSSGAWVAANGNPITVLADFTSATGSIALTAADGVSLYNTTLSSFTATGPTPLTATVDGVNWTGGDATPSAPINSSGQRDTSATKVGTGEPPVGSGFSRVNAAANTASNVTYAEATVTPGVAVINPVNSARHWAIME